MSDDFAERRREQLEREAGFYVPPALEAAFSALDAREVGRALWKVGSVLAGVMEELGDPDELRVPLDTVLSADVSEFDFEVDGDHLIVRAVRRRGAV